MLDLASSKFSGVSAIGGENSIRLPEGMSAHAILPLIETIETPVAIEVERYRRTRMVA